MFFKVNVAHDDWPGPGSIRGCFEERASRLLFFSFFAGLSLINASALFASGYRGPVTTRVPWIDSSMAEQAKESSHLIRAVRLDIGKFFHHTKHTRTHSGKHTRALRPHQQQLVDNTHRDAYQSALNLWVLPPCLSVCLSVCLSLTHTHTHTHRGTLLITRQPQAALPTHLTTPHNSHIYQPSPPSRGSTFGLGRD